MSRPSTFRLLMLFLPLASLQAQPRIYEDGVVNAASYLPPTVPGGAIAPGSIFSIFGENLGPSTLEAQGFPLPAILGGVQALILTADGASVQAPLLYVSPTQINAILPSAVPVGRHRLYVLRDSQPSNDIFIKIVRSSVGIFESQGFSYGRPRPAGASFREPLHPGEPSTLWVTGLGPALVGDSSPGPAGNLPAQVGVFVGGLGAEISYQGRAPCCAGLDQIDYVIPQEAPVGCFVPVWAEVAGDLVSNVVTLNVARPGGQCEAAHDGMLEQNVGGVIEIELQRTFVENVIADEPRATALERKVSLAIVPYLPLRRDDIARTPPAGTCLVPSDPTYVNPFGFEPIEPIAVTGPIGEADLALRSDLSNTPGFPPGEPTHTAAPGSSLQLEPGHYTVESAGSTKLPAFTGELNTGAPARWTNRGSLLSLARETGLKLEFESDGRERRKILASLGMGAPPGPEFAVCHAGSSADAIEIPRAFLANIASERIELTFSDATYHPLDLLGESPYGPTGWITYRRDEKIDVDLGPVHLASTAVTLQSGERIQAELAVTAAERARGLMQRPVLGPDQGMLFLFESSGIQRFWMLNTVIPLDIVWMNSDREVLFISANTPPCQTQVCPTYGPDVPSRYVLELAAGEAARRGLALGDRLAW